jgi:hypothetical protein
MSRLRHLLALVLLLGLLASACGTPVDVADPSDPEAPPTGEPEVPPTADPDAPDDQDEAGPKVTVYFVRANDSGIWVEPETHVLDGPTEAIAHETMELLFTGTPHDPDLLSEAPDDVRVLATNIRDRVLIVDVSEEIGAHSGGSAQEIAFAEQLAHTAAAFDSVDAVQLWIEGAAIDELWGHLDWSQPIEPDPYAVSPITITEPPAGPDEATFTTGDVTVAGEARVFEANFGVRLYGPDGELVAEDFVMASEGAPARGTWEYTFTISEPGTYTVEAEEDDPSDGEGRPPFVTSRTIEVTG